MLTSESLQRLLAASDPSVKVLSAYLDIDAATGPWKEKLYALKQGLDRLQDSLAGTERRQFQQDRRGVEGYLSNFRSSGKSLVLFSSAPVKLFWATVVQVPLPPQLRFEAGLHIAPLAGALDDYQRYCVVLLDNEKARLLVVHLGELEEQRQVKSFAVKQHKQTEFKARLQHRRDEKLQAHLRRLTQELERLHRDKQFNRLIVAGAREPAALLRRQLPVSLRRLVVGSFVAPLYASNSQILEEAARVEARYEHAKEWETVKTLLTRAAKGAQAVTGVDRTLLALRHGDVFEVVVAGNHGQPGCNCPVCGYAAATIVNKCPLCGARTERTDDVIESAIRKAALQGIRIEVVSGEARRELLGAGGLGGFLTQRAA